MLKPINFNEHCAAKTQFGNKRESIALPAVVQRY